MNEKIVAIIQARMGSTRLPGKVMKEIQGKTVLQHVIERVSQSRLIDEIIVATSIGEMDDVIEQEAKASGVIVARGSEDDVLARYYYAARDNCGDIVVRITSDCPLIDPHIIDELISSYHVGNYAIATNAGSNPDQRTFPRGLDAEVFSYGALERAFLNAKEIYQREHVTPYIYENSDSVFYLKNDHDYSKFRWTLDTEEDFELINQVYQLLYSGKHDFYLKEIIELFFKEPSLCQINQHIKQKKLK